MCVMATYFAIWGQRYVAIDEFTSCESTPDCIELINNKNPFAVVYHKCVKYNDRGFYENYTKRYISPAKCTLHAGDHIANYKERHAHKNLFKIHKYIYKSLKLNFSNLSDTYKIYFTLKFPKMYYFKGIAIFVQN